MYNYEKNIVKYFKERDYLCFFDSEEDVLKVLNKDLTDYDLMTLFRYYINNLEDDELKRKIHLYLNIICNNPSYSYDNITNKISEILKTYDNDINYRIMDMVFNDEIFIKKIKNKKNDEDLDEKYYYTDSVKQYIREISKYKLLSKEEEYVLAVKCKNGDKKAREKLINSNLKLVVNIVSKKKYIQEGDFLDAVQIGNLGLIKAVSKYDPELGLRFSTYATYCINTNLYNDMICDKNLLERSDISKLKLINKAKEALSKEFLRNPTYEEIADYTKIKLSEVILIVNKSNYILSLDQKVKENGDEDTCELGNFLKDDNVNVEDTVLNDMVYDDLLSFINIILGERAKEILLLKLGFGGRYQHRITEISKMYNVSKQCISSTYLKSLEKIKELYPMMDKIIQFANEKSLEKYDLRSNLRFKNGENMSAWFQLNKNKLISKCKSISKEYSKYKQGMEVLKLRLTYYELLKIEEFEKLGISCDEFLIIMLNRKNKSLMYEDISELLNMNIEKIKNILSNDNEDMIFKIKKCISGDIKYTELDEKLKEKIMSNSISSN